MQLLDPDYPENYKSPAQVDEACAMDITALEYMVPKVPHPDGDKNIVACWRCVSGEFLCNWDGTPNTFCGQCGQRIDWSKEDDNA